MEVAEWFRAEIATGLQKLLALRLAGTPPEDAIVGTAEVWLEALWPDRVWAEHLDRPRVQQAFRTLFRICDRWPTPKLFLDNLRSRPEPAKLPPPRVTPEEAARNRARIAEVIASLKKTLTTPPKRKEPEHGNEAESKGGTVGATKQGADDGGHPRPRRRAARADPPGNAGE